MTILVLATAKVSLWLAAPLGNDPNGFVPASVGGSPRWRTFVRNESNPYHIPDNVFASEIKTRETVERLIQTHYATHKTKTNGDKKGEDDDDRDVWHWPPEHVAYCLNVLADAVQCTADATPLSFVNGFGSGHLTDGQQAWCRDWDSLRAWAADEERSVDAAQGGAALTGSFGRLWRTILP
ncbi:hypothetical protein KNSL1_008257 [Colletotrichum chrysophilum]|nr:hypothetical protein KNSL1_008257 [Colletotrichum chrysophilum]